MLLYYSSEDPSSMVFPLLLGTKPFTSGLNIDTHRFNLPQFKIVNDITSNRILKHSGIF